MSIYTDMGLRTANPFQWQVGDESDLSKKRKTYLRKLKQTGKSERDVLKNKATRKNLPVDLKAYSDLTNSEKAPR